MWMQRLYYGSGHSKGKHQVDQNEIRMRRTVSDVAKSSEAGSLNVLSAAARRCLRTKGLPSEPPLIATIKPGPEAYSVLKEL